MHGQEFHKAPYMDAAYKDLRDRSFAGAPLDESCSLCGITGEINLAKGDSLRIQELLGAHAVATKTGRIDCYLRHVETIEPQSALVQGPKALQEAILPSNAFMNSLYIQ